MLFFTTFMNYKAFVHRVYFTYLKIMTYRQTTYRNEGPQQYSNILKFLHKGVMNLHNLFRFKICQTV